MPTKKTSSTKSTKKSGSTTSKATARLTTESGELIVRMYRQGLGDCFLLALAASGGTTKYMLIDCGVHKRQTDGPQRMEQVMANIAASTGSHLDVIVATHEHADHLSGIVQRNSPFLRDDFSIGEVWFGWTEKRGDPQADKLRRQRGTAQKVIDKAVQTLEGLGAAGRSAKERLDDVMGFEDPADNAVDVAAVEQAIASSRKASAAEPSVDPLSTLDLSGSPLAAASTRKGTAKKVKPSSNELALGLLTVKAGSSGPVYLEPGAVKKFDAVPGLRAYALGPPRSELLTKEAPTKIRGAKEADPGGLYKEVYLTRGPNWALALSPALDADLPDDAITVPDDWRYPFAKPFRRDCKWQADEEGARTICWDDAPPASTATFIRDTYDDPESAWRRIDTDWLGAAEPLALDLVSDTNNTSLVLALECGDPGTGHVLLFAADAQVGNWLSWRDQTYGEGSRFSADDLLSRVLLYKVGHHGSHNSTVRRDPREPSAADAIGVPFGLELMNDIIALIPVDREAVAKHMPTPWHMPHEPLYRRLREKARRRVLRSDQSLAPLDPDIEEPDEVPGSDKWSAVPGMKGLRWRRSKEDFDVGTEGAVYYDIAIPLAR
jgi:hypothetical protein